MKSVFLALLLYGAASTAQYDQVVKPVRVQELFSFTQFQLRQTMIRFFKNSSDLLIVSPVQMSLIAPIEYADTRITGGISELSIVRTAIETGPLGLKIQESLFLKSCNTRFEIFTIERHDSSISPSADADLLRGIIPGPGSLKFYRLYLMNRTIKIEISRGEKKQRMNLAVSFGTDKSEIHLQVLESFSEQTLTHQHMTGTYKINDRLLEAFSSEYIWNLGPKYSVPRPDPRSLMKLSRLIF